jgi:FKBP-type peptidyl-prolyl cis-trans isomerase FkpA
MTNPKRSVVLSVGLAAVTLVVGAAAGCGKLGGGGATPKTEDEKALYALGLMVGRNISVFNLTPQELEIVKSGLSDSVLKKKPLVDLDTYGPKLDALARSRQTARVGVEKAKAKDVLDAAAREPGAVRLPSGLVFRSTKPGTGESPSPTDRVKVHYVGTLTDGTEFDSSRKRGQPATFPLNGVIKCWTEGVGKMKVGEQAVLTCPSDIAYGDGGRPPTIPGGATLIFNVELLGIEKPTPPPAMSTPPGAPQLQLTPPGGNPHGAMPPPAMKLNPPGSAQQKR